MELGVDRHVEVERSDTKRDKLLATGEEEQEHEHTQHHQPDASSARKRPLTRPAPLHPHVGSQKGSPSAQRIRSPSYLSVGVAISLRIGMQSGYLESKGRRERTSFFARRG